jgi:chromosome segregation ATPase
MANTADLALLETKAKLMEQADLAAKRQYVHWKQMTQDSKDAPEVKTQKLLALLGETFKSLKYNESWNDVLQKQYEVVAGNLDKTNIMNNKLSLLCKELQKSNKEISEEKLQLHEKVTKLVGEISEKMEKTNRDAMEIHEENVRLRDHLKQLTDMVQKRDEYKNQLDKAHDIEKQLHEAQLKELHARLEKTTAELKESLHRELSLREQVEAYAGKFDEFGKAIASSHELFEDMKKTQGTMMQKIRTLEKEKQQLKDKEGKSDLAVIELTKKNATLERLCHVLQEERKARVLAASASTEQPKEETASTTAADPVA